MKGLIRLAGFVAAVSSVAYLLVFAVFSAGGACESTHFLGLVFTPLPPPGGRGNLPFPCDRDTYLHWDWSIYPYPSGDSVLGS